MCCENKATKRNYISQSSALLYDQIKSPRTNSSSIEMPESGYNTQQLPSFWLFLGVSDKLLLGTKLQSCHLQMGKIETCCLCRCTFGANKLF